MQMYSPSCFSEHIRLPVWNVRSSTGHTSTALKQHMHSVMNALHEMLFSDKACCPIHRSLIRPTNCPRCCWQCTSALSSRITLDACSRNAAGSHGTLWLQQACKPEHAGTLPTRKARSQRILDITSKEGARALLSGQTFQLLGWIFWHCPKIVLGCQCGWCS